MYMVKKKMILKCRRCGKEKREPQPELVEHKCCGLIMEEQPDFDPEIGNCICEDFECEPIIEDGCWICNGCREYL